MKLTSTLILSLVFFASQADARRAKGARKLSHDISHETQYVASSADDCGKGKGGKGSGSGSRPRSQDGGRRLSSSKDGCAPSTSPTSLTPAPTEDGSNTYSNDSESWLEPSTRNLRKGNEEKQ